jgi:hypothetical protein
VSTLKLSVNGSDCTVNARENVPLLYALGVRVRDLPITAERILSAAG